MAFERYSIFDFTPIIHNGNKTVLLIGNSEYDELHKTLGKVGGERFVVLPGGYEGRLDLLSTKIYGKPDFWWYLAISNNIFSPEEELIAGRVIIVPDIV